MNFLSKIFMIVSFIFSLGLLVSCGSNSLNSNNGASVLDKITLATSERAEIHVIPIDESEIKDPQVIEPAEVIDCSEFNLTLRTEVRSCLISLIENNVLEIPTDRFTAIDMLKGLGAGEEIATTVVSNNIDLLGVQSDNPNVYDPNNDCNIDATRKNILHCTIFVAEADAGCTWVFNGEDVWYQECGERGTVLDPQGLCHIVDNENKVLGCLQFTFVASCENGAWTYHWDGTWKDGCN